MQAKRRGWMPVIALGVVGGALVGVAAAVAGRADAYSWFDPLIDVHTIVSREFVSEPDADALRDGAISGMLEALNDPYSEFIPASEVREFDKQTRGEFVGIGAEVRMQENGLLIVSPIEDSPAYLGGVLAGDVVTAVDGKPTRGLNVQDCIDMLTGEPGTNVTIAVLRDAQTIEFTLKRAQITTPTVKGVHRNGKQWDFWIDAETKIAYVRLTQFTQASVDDLKHAIQSLLDAGLERGGLVLDVRFNPGGLLPAAIHIADLFLKNGRIVSTRGRAHPEQTYSAVEPGTLPDFPIVILANRQSASAAEILAGALADHSRAVVLGERTYGKGSVQNVLALPSGAGHLKLTEQLYYLPSGRNIHRMDDSTIWGVDPSPGFYVPMTDDEYRTMLEIRRQEEILRASGSPTTNGANWADPAWILDHLKDKQLAAGVEALRGRIDSGEWKPVGGAAPEGDLSSAELKRLDEARRRLERELLRIDRRERALAGGGATLAPEAALIPEGTDLSGGRVTILDKDGKQVATLRITGAGLERWLSGAPVAPETLAAPE